ncbi:MAG: PQQ-like beta-propeller repeat protein [Muribaculaceae bacterium]|nr:PQQ-like beta-propeller repeat protein [Muribaculaceae bacterium]
MRKNYLLMAAAAMLLASCSNEADSPKNPQDENKNEGVITLTALSPQSQASRIQNINGTRDGEKKKRLTLTTKVAPVNAAALNNWSATAVAFGGDDNVYVTWHSDGQAHNPGTPATAWGGAIDVMTYARGGGVSFKSTLTSEESKFNNVIADGSTTNLFVSLTSGKNGASVGRVNIPPVIEDGVQIVMDTIVVPGSSVNCVALDGQTAYAVSGYKGGAFSFSKNFAKGAEIKAIYPYQEDFGGKYITDGYILRTDAEHCYIVPQNGGEAIVTGAPLISSEKYSESFDPATGKWEVGGDNQTLAKYYGKHTMAVDGDYIYVAGGKVDKPENENASKEKNGLRVYDKNTGKQVWGNATNTTAVCVAGDYVYAATGAGLRVYEKFNGKELKLFAFETVPGKDDKGNDVQVAGTDAHSCNFIAVDGNDIYMANGQSGLYIFTLDTTAPEQEETPAE